MARSRTLTEGTLLLLIIALLFPANAGYAGGPEQAPHFELSDLDGKTHRLADYAGTVVLLNFWASWCPECLVEMPTLDLLYRKYRDKGVMVLGISIDRNRETVGRVMERVPVSYPVLFDSEGEVSKKFAITVLPVTLIIDRNGLVQERLFGAYDFGSEEISAKIKKVLDAK